MKRILLIFDLILLAIASSILAWMLSSCATQEKSAGIYVPKEEIFTDLITPTKYTVRIAIIDTGLRLNQISNMKVCKEGHRDFTNTTLQDKHGHGTHVAGLVYQQAMYEDYCAIFIKYIKGDKMDLTGGPDAPLQNTIEAFKYALELKVDMIVYASTGSSPDDEERKIVKKILDRGIVFVTAAGNDGTELKKVDSKDLCESYPACYDEREVVVGNEGPDGNRVCTSNYGKLVDLWIQGVHMKSSNGVVMTGTSQATAIVAGQLVRELSHMKENSSYKSLPLENYRKPHDRPELQHRSNPCYPDFKW